MVGLNLFEHLAHLIGLGLTFFVLNVQSPDFVAGVRENMVNAANPAVFPATMTGEVASIGEAPTGEVS